MENLSVDLSNELPYISVVVPAFNSERTIDGCIQALLNQTYPKDFYEIIIVDDASTDSTGKIAKSYGVKVIQEGKLGRSAARNLGARRSSGEVILFTDSDCEPVPVWIDFMTKPFSDPDVVGVNGAYLTHQSSLVARFTQVEVEERYSRMTKLESVNFVDTYSAAYRRDIFIASNGFDETVDIDEDQELSFRLSRQGYRMVFAPEARVYHQHAETISHYVRRKFEIGTWKPLLINRYPERFLSDSRTPQLLKVQMVLSLLILGMLPFSLFSRNLRQSTKFILFAFLVSCLPFMKHALRYDRQVAFIALPMLLLRAVALGLGYLNGLFKFRLRRGV